MAKAAKINRIVLDNLEVDQELAKKVVVAKKDEAAKKLEYDISKRELDDTLKLFRDVVPEIAKVPGEEAIAVVGEGDQILFKLQKARAVTTVYLAKFIKSVLMYQVPEEHADSILEVLETSELLTMLTLSLTPAKVVYGDMVTDCSKIEHTGARTLKLV